VLFRSEAALLSQQAVAGVCLDQSLARHVIKCSLRFLDGVEGLQGAVGLVEGPALGLT
jgi:hypothetical protein